MNQVKDVMVNDSSVCTTITSIDNIKKTMEEFHREEILLVDTLFEGHLLGMITSSSISRLAVAKSVTPSQLNAEQCMEPLVATIGQNVSVDECLRVMEEKNLARIPVVDETGHYCGVVDKEAMELTTL